MRLGVLVVLFIGMCKCMSYKEIDQVALYIRTLQEAGLTTIFSLFDIDRQADRQEIAKKQSKLIKACYMAKMKGLPMPIGKNLTENEAKNIIVNGYQILVQPELRKAYNWILDEAHPQFMENYKAKTQRREHVRISMPSIGALAVSIVFTLIVFDALRVYISQSMKVKEALAAKTNKKMKKKQTAPAIDMKGMYICKAYAACHDMINRLAGKAQNK
ncbi:hypothetical protein NERG_01663 [Nematocida ausubeli]|uniref:J domain-containing protein n=1 Tax=Nematocida ausubeli (strain ATCC PRA-371 / ERTm2) TaxID=1913371 RepID=H8ZDJ2_NEMA1|nr:hypothetical protein NERG_01663 [Nematocida ausubeli]